MFSRLEKTLRYDDLVQPSRGETVAVTPPPTLALRLPPICRDTEFKWGPFIHLVDVGFAEFCGTAYVTFRVLPRRV